MINNIEQFYNVPTENGFELTYADAIRELKVEYGDIEDDFIGSNVITESNVYYTGYLHCLIGPALTIKGHFENESPVDLYYVDGLLARGPKEFLSHASKYLDENMKIKNIKVEATVDLSNALKEDTENKSDGGPSTYYDAFPKDVKTANDIIEHLAVSRWKEHSCHMKDIFKAITRWGSKDGTSIEYDAKKIIYSGIRLFRMIKGNAATREYLQKLLDDPQFKEDD